MAEKYEELAPEAVEPTTELAPQPEAKAVVQLAMPAKELALSLLGKVDFARCLTGYKILMNIRAKEVSICSLAEAIDFIDLCCHSYNGDKVLREGNRRFIARLELISLIDWVRQSLGDTELAKAIKDEIGEDCQSRRVDQKGRDFLKHAAPIKMLMQQRLEQCRQVAA